MRAVAASVEEVDLACRYSHEKIPLVSSLSDKGAESFELIATVPYSRPSNKAEDSQKNEVFSPGSPQIVPIKFGDVKGIFVFVIQLTFNVAETPNGLLTLRCSYRSTAFHAVRDKLYTDREKRSLFFAPDG